MGNDQKKNWPKIGPLLNIFVCFGPTKSEFYDEFKTNVFALLGKVNGYVIDWFGQKYAFNSHIVAKNVPPFWPKSIIFQ